MESKKAWRRASSEAASRSGVDGGWKSIAGQRECGSTVVVKDRAMSGLTMQFVGGHVQECRVLQEGEYDVVRSGKQRRQEKHEGRGQQV